MIGFSKKILIEQESKGLYVYKKKKTFVRSDRRAVGFYNFNAGRIREMYRYYRAESDIYIYIFFFASISLFY